MVLGYNVPSHSLETEVVHQAVRHSGCFVFLCMLFWKSGKHGSLTEQLVLEINLIYLVWLMNFIISWQIQLYWSWQLSSYSVSDKIIKSILVLVKIVSASVLLGLSKWSYLFSHGHIGWPCPVGKHECLQKTKSLQILIMCLCIWLRWDLLINCSQPILILVILILYLSQSFFWWHQGTC